MGHPRVRLGRARPVGSSTSVVARVEATGSVDVTRIVDPPSRKFSPTNSASGNERVERTRPVSGSTRSIPPPLPDQGEAKVRPSGENVPANRRRLLEDPRLDR